MPSFYDTILYPREAFPDLNAWKAQVDGKPMFSEADLGELQTYVASLPTSAEIQNMSDADRQAFSDRRRWALVYYSLSLATERNPTPIPTTAGFTVARQ
jgi:hypothetical protein